MTFELSATVTPVCLQSLESVPLGLGIEQYQVELSPAGGASRTVQVPAGTLSIVYAPSAPVIANGSPPSNWPLPFLST